MSAGSILMRSARLLPTYALIAFSSAAAVVAIIFLQALVELTGIEGSWPVHLVQVGAIAVALVSLYEKKWGKHNIMASVFMKIEVSVKGLDSKDVEEVTKKLLDQQKKKRDSEKTEKSEK